jgi:hypothetical protein
MLLPILTRSLRLIGGRSLPLILFEHQFVDETPHPRFARLDRLHDRVFRRMEVFGGVLIF